MDTVRYACMDTVRYACMEIVRYACMDTVRYACMETVRYACMDTFSVTCSSGLYVHDLMRDEKDGRKKQARLNKQQGKATQHTQVSHFS